MYATPRNRRRMTMGGDVPSAQKTAGRRMSIDPSSSSGIPRPAGGPGRPPKGRKSMLPRVGRENAPPPPSPANSVSSVSSVSSVTKSTASSRRRSMGGKDKSRRQSLVPPPSQSKPSDPRPVNDKAFQHQCIKQLLAFLHESGYEYPLSHKSLSRPSAKDFTNITTFMLRRIDPTFQTGSMKFEDEVALNFKCLGYPYTISKTALVAAGSLHTWPALLAALTWLMEQIQICGADTTTEEEAALLQAGTEEDTTPFDSLQELELKTDKAFFLYLGQAYVAFMRGDGAMTERLESALADRFERDDAVLEQAVERITDLNATILEKINTLSQESQDLPAYAKKREDYATDLEQFHDLIRKMGEHKAALEKKVKDRTAELAETEGKLKKMAKHVEDLKKTVEEQHLSVDDVRKMESEIKGISEAMDRATTLKEQRKKILLSTQSEVERVCNDIDSRVAMYSSALSDVQLVPEIGSTFANMKAVLDRNQLESSDTSKFLGVDLEGVVRPTALQTKRETMRKVDDVKAEHQDELDKMERGKEACGEAEAKLQIVVEKKSKSEQSLESEEQAFAAKLAVRQREVETMENKVASLRDPVALEEQMAAYERQCTELEALRVQHQEENIAKKKAVVEEINAACTLMEEHTQHLRGKFQELDEYWKKKEEQMNDVCVPPNIVLDN